MNTKQALFELCFLGMLTSSGRGNTIVGNKSNVSSNSIVRNNPKLPLPRPAKKKISNNATSNPTVGHGNNVPRPPPVDTTNADPASLLKSMLKESKITGNDECRMLVGIAILAMSSWVQ